LPLSLITLNTKFVFQVQRRNFVIVALYRKL